MPVVDRQIGEYCLRSKKMDSCAGMRRIMNERDKRILDQLARRIRERFPDARLWAFGSRARGKGEPDSDLDVCIVVDQLDEQIDHEIIGLAWEVGFENDMIITTVTFSTQTFEAGPCSRSSLVRSVLGEGVEV